MFNKKSAFGLIEALISLTIATTLVAATTTTTRFLAQNAQLAQDTVQMQALASQVMESALFLAEQNRPGFKTATENTSESEFVFYRTATNEIKMCASSCAGSITPQVISPNAGATTINNTNSILKGQIIGVTDSATKSLLNPGANFSPINMDSLPNNRYYIVSSKISDRTIEGVEMRLISVTIWPFDQTDKKVTLDSLISLP